MPNPRIGSAERASAPVSSDKALKTEAEKANRRGSLKQDPQPQEPGTWYQGGTWRRGSKATPVTQVAKESIFAATDKASEIITTARSPLTSAVGPSKRSSSAYLSRNIESPVRSSSLHASAKKPLAEATPSKTPNGSVQQLIMPIRTPPQDKDSVQVNKPTVKKEENAPPLATNTDPQPADTAKSKKPAAHNANTITSNTLWRGWFSRHEETPGFKPDPPKTQEATNESTVAHIGNPIQRRTSNPELASANAEEATIPRSWLGLWSATRSSKAEPTDAAAPEIKSSTKRPQSSSEMTTPKEDADASKAVPTAKSPGWAFWSREVTKDSGDNASNRNVGELALAGSPSQSHPESAVLDEASGVLGKRPRSVEPSGKAGTPQPQRQKTQKEQSAEPDGTSTPRMHPETELRGADKSTNLLLPQLRFTYRPAEKPSLLQSLNRLWQYNRSIDAGQVEFLSHPPRIKRALTIVSVYSIARASSCSGMSPFEQRYAKNCAHTP